VDDSFYRSSDTYLVDASCTDGGTCRMRRVTTGGFVRALGSRCKLPTEDFAGSVTKSGASSGGEQPYQLGADPHGACSAGGEAARFGTARHNFGMKSSLGEKERRGRRRLGAE
jgi:hypothetical protein